MSSEDSVPAPLRRLWGLSEPSRLGRRAALDVTLVVTAAVELADRDGLGGVTLPKVAQRLGVTGMSPPCPGMAAAWPGVSRRSCAIGGYSEPGGVMKQ